jgi:hypothetical protein
VSPAARVEVDTRRVVVGERAWRFDIDCRSGTVTVDFDGSPLRVRPLRWREKVVLARFAALGADVVDEQVLRLALDGSPEPAAGPEREAAFALALWVGAPGADELPLSTSLLAAVTVDVCTAVGLAPADLDARDAAEVEALWRCTSGVEASRRRAASTEADDTTRILVVPDAPAQREPARGRDASGEAVPEPGPAAEDGEVAAPTGAHPLSGVSTTTPPAGADDAPHPGHLGGTGATRAGKAAAVRRFQPLSIEPSAVRPTGPAREAEATAAAPVDGEPGAFPEPAATGRGPAVGEDGAVAYPLSPWYASREGVRRGAPAQALAGGPAQVGHRLDATPAAGLSLPTPVATATWDAEDVLAELSEQLARAADDLGIPEV